MLRAVFGLLYESTGEEASEGEREMARGLVEEVLVKGPFSSGRTSGVGGQEGRKVPDGVRYHVLDVWVDELERVLKEGEEESSRSIERRKAAFDMVVGLVEGVAREALTKGVRIRAKESLADERLLEWK